MTEEVKKENEEVILMKEEADGSVTIGEEKKEAAPAEEPQEDNSLKAEDTQDEEGHAEETVEEAEERRERNRKRRAENKQRRQDYVESLKRELAARDQVINDLSTRVASVERQSQGSQMAQVDKAMQEAEQYYNHFKQVHQQAIDTANGALATDATEKMFAAKQRYDMLANAKRNMSQQVQQPKPLDPRMQKHAEDWMTANAWYDPSGTDMDSDLVLKIDDRLVQEGWNPATPEYWDELTARAKKYLPHRFNSGYNNGQPAVKPQARVPVAGASGSTNSGNKGTYHLSADRVQALKDAGMWDDPATRQKMIKRYQEQDRQAKQ